MPLVRSRRRSRSRSGLRSAEKPIANFLFARPTGVGKTNWRESTAHPRYQFIRFDMSEYMEKHAVSRLIGAPPGYVGYEEGGLLIDAIRKAPHAVLLLDEIEKAHPDMFSILLQVMDHATLTDSHGRKADFRHVILIMTTNAGARDLSDRRVGFGDSAIGASSRGALERMFMPEFRNRLDAIVTFHVTQGRRRSRRWWTSRSRAAGDGDRQARDDRLTPEARAFWRRRGSTAFAPPGYRLSVWSRSRCRKRCCSDHFPGAAAHITVQDGEIRLSWCG
jgi:hypothetical protein